MFDLLVVQEVRMPAKPKKKLREKQKRILAALKRFQRHYGYSPSMRELGALVGISSPSVVKYNYDQLEEMGYFERDPGVSRGVRLIDQRSQPTSDNVHIPLISTVSAGPWLHIPSSDFAYYDPESMYEVTQSQLPPGERGKDLYAIKIQGDSMIDAMINDGDTVIMKPAHEARNGEMVAVWRTDKNETTLKRFYKEKDRVRLQPENPAMKAIYVDDPSTLQVHGKVVMVIKDLSGPAS
jgi:repressor LexA